MSGGLVEVQSMVNVGWSLVVQGFVGMDQHLELASLLYGKPEEFLEVGGDVGPFGEIEDEFGR